MSDEHNLFLKKNKRKKILIILTRISILIVIIFLWELMSHLELINTFLTSSPSLIVKTIINLIKTNNFFNHISITIFETIISFILSTFIGLFIASILWWNKFISKVFEPYLTIINSMPKVALGPIFIIWIGANIKSIIFMAIMISIFITIINLENAFSNTDENKIKYLKSLKASKWQIYRMLIIPSNIKNIINVLKINISMSLIGISMGELLVSKEGIGYLIMYGSQVFNLNLVMTGIVLLCFISFVMYYIISYIEKRITKY